MGGMTRLLLLLWAGVTVSTAMDLHKRIIGGRECDNDQRHFHVKLQLPRGKTDICGGSLISDRWILTAKHCRDKTITAHLGLHPRPGQNIPPMQITDPPVFFNENHDIMLLKLPRAVQIQPVALPTTADCANAPEIGATVQIAGYGPTATAPLSQTLQCADTTVVQCILVNNPRYEFCGDTQTVRQMPGDSGGGVMYNNKLHGVISDEIMFLKVCGYLEWINNTTNQR